MTEEITNNEITLMATFDKLANRQKLEPWQRETAWSHFKRMVKQMGVEEAMKYPLSC